MHLHTHNAMPLELDCYCASLRQATRAVTQMYDRALAPAGLTITQFTLLRVLSQAGSARVGDLAGLLGVEQSAMTRTLALMHQAGWTEKDPSATGRETRYRLTPDGRKQLQRALPAWRGAQQRMAHIAGRDAEHLRALAHAVSSKLHA